MLQLLRLNEKVPSAHTQSITQHHFTPSSIPIDLRPPPLLQLLLQLPRRVRFTYLQLNPLPCTQHLTLQVKATSALRIIDIKEPLKLLVRFGEIRLTAGRRRNVKNAAGLVEREPGGRERVGSGGVAAVGLGVFLRGGGLFPGLGESAAEDARAGEDDLGYDAVRLDGVL